MSKEKNTKKRTKLNTGEIESVSQPPGKRILTQEEKARIIRDRLANRPVIVFRYPNGKLNKRFIIMLSLLVIGMIVALYFLSRM